MYVDDTEAAAYPLAVITRSFPILATPDLGRALAFYVDALGGAVTYRFPETGDLEYVTLRLGSSGLGLGVNEHVTGAPEPERFQLCAYTPDVDAAVKKLRAAGVRIVDEPKDQRWGERMARVLDPDGNRVTLFSEQP